jgi:hypothetical protein
MRGGANLWIIERSSQLRVCVWPLLLRPASSLIGSDLYIGAGGGGPQRL